MDPNTSRPTRAQRYASRRPEGVAGPLPPLTRPSRRSLVGGRLEEAPASDTPDHAIEPNVHGEQPLPQEGSTPKRKATEDAAVESDARPTVRRRVSSPNTDVRSSGSESDISQGPAPVDPEIAASREASETNDRSAKSESNISDEPALDPDLADWLNQNEAARTSALLNGSFGAKLHARSEAQLEHIANAALEDIFFEEDLEEHRDIFVTLWSGSPELKKTLREATWAGPITVRSIDRDEPNQTIRWAFERRTICVRDDLGGIASNIIYELINASNTEFFHMALEYIDNGKFEAAAGAAGSDAAAMLLARNYELIEWTASYRHHAIFVELRRAGIPFDDRLDMFAEAFEPAPDGAEALWADFEGCLAHQQATGHTQRYIDMYHLRREWAQSAAKVAPLITRNDLTVNMVGQVRRLDLSVRQASWLSKVTNSRMRWKPRAVKT